MEHECNRRLHAWASSRLGEVERDARRGNPGLCRGLGRLRDAAAGKAEEVDERRYAAYSGGKTTL